MNRYQRTAFALTISLFFIVQLSLASGNEPSGKERIPDLSNYGITAEEYNALPSRIQKRIPDELQKTDSVLLVVALVADVNGAVYPKQFEVEGVNGSIIHTKDEVYEVRDADKKLLGVFKKSKSGKGKTVCNANGDLIYNSMGLDGMAWVGLGFGGLILVYGLYLLLYLALYSDSDR